MFNSRARKRVGFPGSRTHFQVAATTLIALRESGALDGFPTHGWIGDKGYLGLGMITPFRKPAHRDLLDWEKEFNTQINKIRYVIERAIANFKTWRIAHTDYRRPLKTFPETISAVIALHFFRMAT